MITGDAASIASSLSSVLSYVFGGDFPRDPLLLHQVAARAMILYLGGLAIVRLGKSRIITRMSPLDVILGFVLGSLLSRGMTGHASLSGTLIASAAVVGIHWLLSLLACRSHTFGNLIKGHSRRIVQDGQPLLDNMRQHHLSLHDLQEQLRLQGVEDLSQVREAYKERSGDVSVLRRKKPCQIIEVAVENGVQTVRIRLEP